MQFSSFSRLEENLTITLYNVIPIENLSTIKYYSDNSAGTFSKKEFRWSFNNAYWSSWETLTQGAISRIDMHDNHYFFLQVRYVLTTEDSGTVSTFTLNYAIGDSSTTSAVINRGVQMSDSSTVRIHEIYIVTS
jgi:hypothetical protein